MMSRVISGKLQFPSIRSSFLKRFFSSSPQVSLKRLEGEDTGIAVLQLKRPESRNALGKQMMHEFAESMDHAENDSNIRVVIVQSLVDKIFCAGADLKVSDTNHNKNEFNPC